MDAWCGPLYVSATCFDCAFVVAACLCAAWGVGGVCLQGRGDALPAPGMLQQVQMPASPPHCSLMSNLMHVAFSLVVSPCGEVVPVVVGVLHGCGELQVGGSGDGGSEGFLVYSTHG